MDSLNYNLNYTSNDVFEELKGKDSVADINEYIIGKLPGYNGVIDKGGKYRMKLLENMSTVQFIPSGFKLDWNELVKVGEGKAPDLKKVLTGAASTTEAIAAFRETLEANGLSPYSKLTVIASNDSSINESISNTYEDSFIADTANKMSESSWFKSIKSGTKMADSVYDSHAIQSKISDLTKGNSTADMASLFLKGFRIAIPKIWANTNYNSSLALTIKLNSPAGDPEAVNKLVLEPLRYLISLAAPITKTGIFYGQPYVFNVKASGLMHFKLAAISNIIVTRGGADTVFNKYSQPLSVEVRLTVVPLVNGYAMAFKGNDLYDNDDKDGPFINNPAMTAASFMNGKFSI